MKQGKKCLISILFSSLLCLSACSNILTSKQKVDKFYTLNAVEFTAENGAFIDETLVIEKPILAKGLDSDQIILMRSAQRLDYYAGARWSGLLDKMIQMNLIESFENSEVLSKVTGERGGVNANYALLVDIYDFQAEYRHIDEPPVIHVKMVAKLVTIPTRNMVASFSAEVYEQAEENELSAIMAAFDDSFQGAQALILMETIDYFRVN